MFTRTKRYGHTQISATFQWDNGDPSAGIAAGWGEATGAQVIVPLNFRANGDSFEVGAAFVTWITFRDRANQSIYVRIDTQDLATWIIDDVTHFYRDAEGSLHSLADTLRYLHSGEPIDPKDVLRLSELPEVLDVVRDALEDYRAAERLQSAQEAVYLAEAYLDEIGSGIERLDPDEEVIRDAKVEVNKARLEFVDAQAHARERGVA